MKKIFLLVLVLVCLFSVAMAEETDRDGTGNYAWINYEPNEHGHYEAKEYRDDGSIRCECCIDSDSGLYHKGTIYTKDGKVFFSGEFGEGFDWNLMYVR